MDDEDEADAEVVGAWGLGLAAGASVFEPDGTALRPLRSIFSIALPALRRSHDFSAADSAPPCSSRSPFLLMNAFSMRNVFCADSTSFFSPSSQRAIVFSPSTLQRVSSGRSCSSHQSFAGTFDRASDVSFTSSSFTILREIMFLICTWNLSGRLYAMCPSVTIAVR
uniref:Uncharacterized protein n=1 Tax=Anopheles melas TaxID=34690 RepID=A0A182UGD2_9DIPT